VRLGDRPADREPEPESPGTGADVGVRLIKGVEDTFADRVVDADPRVGELHDQTLSKAGASRAVALFVARAGSVARADREYAAGRREARRVADQVPDDLHQPRVVSGDLMISGGEIEFDVESRDERLDAADFHAIADRPVYVDRFQIQEQPSAGDPRHVQEVVDQSRFEFDVPLDHFQDRADVRVENMIASFEE
jgi:hypothetical protein